VDDAIADIATVFHWSPAAFDEMTIFELAYWREKARARAETENP
jgi:phage P2 gpE